MLRPLWAYLKEGVAGIRKESAKYVARALVTLVLGGIALRFSNGKIPDGLLEDGKFSIGLVPSWAWGSFESGSSTYANYLIDHPLRTIGFVLLVIWTLVAIWLLIQFRNHIVSFIAENSRRKSLLTEVGLFEFWPDANVDSREAQWSEMSVRIINPPQTVLKIIGATGWDSFGAKSSPLHDALHSFEGRVFVILMNPESEYLGERAASVSMATATYRNQIRKSLKCLKELKKRGHYIDVRLYNSPPNWKMIFTPLTLWLQHYRNDKHVAESPVYMFYATSDMQGLYHAYAKDFDRIWRLSDEYELGV